MKELKRYILTHRNKIFDLSMQHISGNSSMLGGWGKGHNSYIGHRLEVGEEYPIENETEQGFIIKTSNSILDFVEVGDLISLGDGLPYNVLLITDFDFIIDNNKHVPKKWVDIIWKKQENRDYISYKIENGGN